MVFIGRGNRLSMRSRPRLGESGLPAHRPSFVRPSRSVSGWSPSYRDGRNARIEASGPSRWVSAAQGRGTLWLVRETRRTGRKNSAQFASHRNVKLSAAAAHDVGQSTRAPEHFPASLAVLTFVHQLRGPQL